MSGNITVIYVCDLRAVAEAFGEEANHVARQVRLARLAAAEGMATESAHPSAELRDLEWADGIAFGTPAGDGVPAPELMRFIEATEPLWSSGRLYDKAVTVFTDEPEHMAPDSFAPQLPDRITHLAFPLTYRGRCIEVGIEHDQATYRLLHGQPLELTHYGEPITVSRNKVRRPIRPRQPRGRTSQLRGRAPAHRQPPRPIRPAKVAS